MGFTPVERALLALAFSLYSGSALAVVDWTDQLCSITGGTTPSKGLVANAANPKLACCSNGWAEDAPGSKFDCVETQRPLLSDFDALYNDPGMGNNTTSDSLARPNRVFILDTVTQQPVPGFYTREGLRCDYLAPKTIAQQFALFDTAAATRIIPLTDVLPSCTRLIRVAMEAVCPPASKTTLVQTQTIGAITYRRCTAAMTIQLHIGVTDLSAGSGNHGTYTIVTSFDPDPLNPQAGKTIDFVRTNPISFSKILKISAPASCLGSPALSFDVPTQSCRIN